MINYLIITTYNYAENGNNYAQNYWSRWDW